MPERLLPLEFPHVYVFAMRLVKSFWERDFFKENLQKKARNFNV